MADMEWLEAIEERTRSWPEEDNDHTHLQTRWAVLAGALNNAKGDNRKLTAAVRLAEEEAHRAEEAIDQFGADAAYVIIRSLVLRLRSGEVEG